jgi:hypothetical protein
LALAYVQAHRDELIKVACDTVRIADGLRELAKQEARRRAKARAALMTLAKGRDYN